MTPWLKRTSGGYPGKHKPDTVTSSPQDTILLFTLCDVTMGGISFRCRWQMQERLSAWQTFRTDGTVMKDYHLHHVLSLTDLNNVPRKQLRSQIACEYLLSYLCRLLALERTHSGKIISNCSSCKHSLLCLK